MAGGAGGVTGDNTITSRSGSDATVMAYGPAGDMQISYGKPVTLAGLVGDTKSMLIAGVLLLLVLRLRRKHKG